MRRFWIFDFGFWIAEQVLAACLSTAGTRDRKCIDLQRSGTELTELTELRAPGFWQTRSKTRPSRGRGGR